MPRKESITVIALCVSKKLELKNHYNEHLMHFLSYFISVDLQRICPT